MMLTCWQSLLLNDDEKSMDDEGPLARERCQSLDRLTGLASRVALSVQTFKPQAQMLNQPGLHVS